MNQRPSTAVRVADLNRSVAFYTKLAGFTLIEHRPEADVAVVAYNGCPLLLAGPAAADLAAYLSEVNKVEKPGAVLHFPPSGEIDEMLATYQARGIPGVKLEETWWGDRTLTFPIPGRRRSTTPAGPSALP
ncbi:VOC family protein [Geochorda subterranea]|uniref:VOC family protein n=1 Tax=Geochorda subterranea TaxID=3109564 RepID=A0ABZ1BR48_9FIRM|nr:VOC family protein [Limnochorda sp. LNt]WRP14926.1 VOC family protein [Limnochorda sp. LNt]